MRERSGVLASSEHHKSFLVAVSVTGVWRKLQRQITFERKLDDIRIIVLRQTCLLKDSGPKLLKQLILHRSSL
jgi:hypothetical protein